MNKPNLITTVASKAGISKNQATLALQTLISTLRGGKGKKFVYVGDNQDRYTGLVVKKGKTYRVGFEASPPTKRETRLSRSKDSSPTVSGTIRISQPIRINGPFATPYDTGKALGLSRPNIEKVIRRAERLPFGTRLASAAKNKSGATNAKARKSSKKKSSKAKG